MSDRLPINDALLEEARQRAEVLVVGLMSSDPLEVAQWVPQLRPREEDWEKAFLPHVIPALRAYFGPIFNDDPVPKPKPGQTEVRISVAQAEHFWDKNPISKRISVGMQKIVHVLQPGSIWIDWRYVRPGRKWGLKYNGLVYFPDEGRFAWFPFPFEALKEYYRALPDDD